MTTLEDQIRAIVRDELAKQVKPANTNELLSPRQAGAIAGVAPKTIRRWVDEGRLVRHAAGRHVRVLRADLEKLLASPRRQPTNETPEQRAARRFR